MRVGYLLTGVVVLLVAGILTSPIYAEIGSETIVAFWNFDEGEGGTAKDSSENKLDGELTGGPNWVDGKVAKALEFDGSDDYVEVSDISTPPILTFACWFKKTGSGNGGVPRLHSRGTSPWSLEFGIGNTHQPNQLEFYLAFTDGSTTNWTAFFEPEEEVWYHTAISYDGTWVRTYVDGEEFYSSKDWADKEINQGISRIGGHAPGGDCFQGVIDEVILFDVALSEDDIRSLMTGKWTSVDPLGKAAWIWGNIKSRR
jgi:hypothetical protein